MEIIIPMLIIVFITIVVHQVSYREGRKEADFGKVLIIDTLREIIETDEECRVNAHKNARCYDKYHDSIEKAKVVLKQFGKDVKHEK